MHPSLPAGASLASIALLLSTLPCPAQNWSVTSPNRAITVTIELSAATGKLAYRVEHGRGNERTTVLRDSPLGLRTSDHDLTTGLQLDSVQPIKAVEDSYTLLHGKRARCSNRANALTLLFRNPQNARLELDFRAYDDGVAFRYRLPGSGGTATLAAEATGFALPADAKFWAAPSDKPTMYSPAYETYYQNEVPAGSIAELGMGWSFPMLFRTADTNHWGLITEANVGTNTCGCRLSSAASNGAYTVEFPNPAEGNSHGAAKPVSTLPWELPWRVLILGDSPAAPIESTLVTDLSAPSAVNDTSWVKPGRVAWSWWSDQPSPRNANTQKKFIDLAADMGWEYILVDANWTIMDVGNVREVLDYAKQKGIGVLLWYNSGGPHNLVTEKPRDTLTYPSVREFELKMLQDWGVKGIKVDFFQSDKQEAINLYQGILAQAAPHHIMVNFHGCTLPRGWERTYPHLMSMEAVRGEECYIFDPKYPAAAPVQNTILPFTRNAVGPMDYTPVGLSNNQYPHLTTAAHELALSVLFETAWLHFADKPEAYLNLPPAPKQFLKNVPVAWDDTRFVDGYPGRFLVIARRKADSWWVVGVNGADQNRQVNIKPGNWLPAGRYQLALVADGDNPATFHSRPLALQSGESFPVKMLPFGGFAAVLIPAT